MMIDTRTATIVEHARRAKADAAVAIKAISLLDLTTLADDDDDDRVRALCARASTPVGPTAAVCVWSRFVPTARATLSGAGVRVATVVNFPSGESDPALVADETRRARALGADEIDVVIPHRRFVDGDIAPTIAVLRSCREATGDAPMKVILESGAFDDQATLARAAEIALDQGADFLKTSTGKIKAGASLEAAMILLTAVTRAGRPAGVKISGGVRDADQAAAYLAVALAVAGEDWATPRTFRFGASSVLDQLIAVATGGDATRGANPSGY